MEVGSEGVTKRNTHPRNLQSEPLDEGWRFLLQDVLVYLVGARVKRSTLGMGHAYHLRALGHVHPTVHALHLLVKQEGINGLCGDTFDGPVYRLHEIYGRAGGCVVVGGCIGVYGCIGEYGVSS